MGISQILLIILSLHSVLFTDIYPNKQLQVSAKFWLYFVNSTLTSTSVRLLRKHSYFQIIQTILAQIDTPENIQDGNLKILMSFCLQNYLSKVNLKAAMLLSSQRHSETVFFKSLINILIDYKIILLCSGVPDMAISVMEICICITNLHCFILD